MYPTELSHPNFQVLIWHTHVWHPRTLSRVFWQRVLYWIFWMLANHNASIPCFDFFLQCYKDAANFISSHNIEKGVISITIFQKLFTALFAILYVLWVCVNTFYDNSVARYCLLLLSVCLDGWRCVVAWFDNCFESISSTFCQCFSSVIEIDRSL